MGSPDAEKSAAISLRSEEQSENETDHPNYWHGHQKQRFLGGGWALRPRLEVSPWEWAGLGSVETAWGTRNQSVRFAGKKPPQGSGKQSVGGALQRLPGRLESRVSWVEAAIH